MRLSTVVGSMAVLLVAAPLAAQQAGEPEEQVHVVGTGDTLWDLARRYLSDSYRWPEIFSRNRERITDPHWIYPRQQIVIPGTRSVATDATAVSLPRPTRTVFFQNDVARLGDGNRVVLETRPDEVPVVESGTFYDAGVLRPDSLVVPIGRLEEVVSPTAVPRRLGKQIQPFDRVYLSVRGDVAVGRRIHFMRPGREVEPYGRIFISTGTGVVLEAANGRATVEIDRMYDRLAPGDIALPLPVFAVPSGIRPMPAAGPEGVLLAFEPEQTLASREDLAYINLGRESGITEGDEFVAYLPASVAEWGMRPAVEVATLQVVRAGPRTSAVRVVVLQQPALREGLPIRLVARMP